MGLRSLDAPARALLLDPSAGSARARADAAAELAPGLPAARFARARALWDEGRPGPAWSELRAGVAALSSHVEAWLWVRAVGLAALAAACVIGGVLFLLLSGVAALPAAVRDLGGLPISMPAPSRLALLVGILLVPAALGEGLLGVALALAALGFAYARLGSRLAIGAAALLVGAGLFPLGERAGGALTALGADPVAEAVFAVEHGFPDGAALARVERAASHDALAAGAQALRARRAGAFALADARFAPLVATDEPRWLNNAANVSLALGRVEEAVQRYERSARLASSPVTLFNLSQAYGRAVELEQQELALTEAQMLDAEVVGDLTRAFTGLPAGIGVDLPAGVDALAPRLRDPGAAARWAAARRRGVAPGSLGTGAALFGAGLAGVLALGALSGVALRRLSRGRGDPFTENVAQLLQGRSGDPSERMERLAELRERQVRAERFQLALSVCVPGAAGVLGRRPVLGLAASVSFAAALAIWPRGALLVPDPLAVGAGAIWLATAAAVACAGGCVLATVCALWLRERA